MFNSLKESQVHLSEPRVLYVLKGLPASGKSFWAKQFLKENKDFKKINRDLLREMLDNPVWSRENEEFVVEIQNMCVLAAFRAGYNVILDNTHMVPKTLKKIHQLAQNYGNVKVIEKAFNISVEEAVARNSFREGVACVPEEVIRKMAREAGLDTGKVLEDKEVFYGR